MRRSAIIMKWVKLWWKAVLFGIIGILFVLKGAFHIGIVIIGIAVLMAVMSVAKFIKWILGLGS